MNLVSIALFGSALPGEMHEDSDIDLIIISSDFRNKDIFERSQMTMKPDIATLKKYKISMVTQLRCHLWSLSGIIDN